MMMTGVFSSRSADETTKLGEDLARGLSTGDVVAFRGDLGAGKTTMIKGIAGAFGIDPREVSSPSFALIHEYCGEVTIYHIDLYRIEKPEELTQLGLWEIFEGEGICLVEWPERAEAIIPKRAIRVEISRLEDDERRIQIFKP